VLASETFGAGDLVRVTVFQNPVLATETRLSGCGTLAGLAAAYMVVIETRHQRNMRDRCLNVPAGGELDVLAWVRRLLDAGPGALSRRPGRERIP